MSIESGMPSNHLILYHPLLLLTSIFPASGSFPVSWLFVSDGQNIGASASASVLIKNIQVLFPLGLTGLISYNWVTFTHFTFIGRTDAEAEAPIFWPSDVKCWLIRKDPDYGKDWRQEENGTTEDKMAGWHHWLNRHKFEQVLGDVEGQGSLMCCSPWSCEYSDTTE